MIENGERTAYRETFSYYTGLSSSRVPGIGQRRRFMVLNGTSNMELLYTDNNFNSSDASAILALIDSVIPASGGTGTHTFEAWQSASTLPDGLSGANDDADGDGLPNLLEYRLGTSATTANGGLPITAVKNGLGDFGVSFSERTDTAGVDTVVEVSADMVNWDPIETPYDSWPREGIDDSTQRVMVTLPGSGEDLFVRLRVTLEP